jgi:hypothetical protein
VVVQLPNLAHAQQRGGLSGIGEVEFGRIDQTLVFPTDARLYDRARERLVKTARKQGLRIKQSYERVG